MSIQPNTHINIPANSEAGPRGTLPDALAALGNYSQFIAWRSEPYRIASDGKTYPAGDLRTAGYTDADIEALAIDENEKPIKVPYGSNRYPGSINNAANWLSHAEAVARVAAWNSDNGDGSQPFGVGFVLADDPFFVVDADSCLDELTGQWRPIVQEIANMLPGCGIETSISGVGCHYWGKYQGNLPAHGNRNTAAGLEFYVKDRYIALGQPQANGDAGKDCTAGLQDVIAAYFTPDKANGNGSAADAPTWTTGPVSEWNGPAEDAELLRIARAARSVAILDDSKATFSQLYDADGEALGRAFPPQSTGQTWDYSSADFSLAVRLAFWCGKDCERMSRLMFASELRRDKWADRPQYVRATILEAVGRQTAVYTRQQGNGARGPETALHSPQTTMTGDAKVGELDVATMIENGFRSQHCYAVDSGYWYSREPGKLWRLDKRTIRLRQLIRSHMAPLNMKRGFQVMGIIKFLESGLADYEKWDDNPHLIGLPDDTVLDVRNGAIRKANNDDRVSRRLNVMPRTGEPVTWLKFLRDTHAGKPDVAAVLRYLQIFAGYALTGLTNSHKFLFLAGPPGGGKGTFVNTLANIWGTGGNEGYATSIPSDALLDGRAQHAQWLTLFDGPRMAFVGESNSDAAGQRGRSWRIGDLKTLTAFDIISANKMRQDSYTFQPTAKLIIGANNIPDMRRFDEALRRRMVLVRCDNPVPEHRQDIDLGEKIAAEYGQILSWALQGAAEYCRAGLPALPDSVRIARDDYLDAQDTFGEFLRERFVVGPGAFVPAETLKNEQTIWLHQNPDGLAWTDRLRKQEMTNRGYLAKLKRIPGGGPVRCYFGLRVKQPGEI